MACVSHVKLKHRNLHITDRARHGTINCIQLEGKCERCACLENFSKQLLASMCANFIYLNVVRAATENNILVTCFFSPATNTTSIQS